jgi:putative membrane protein
MLHYFIQALVTAVGVLIAARIVPGVRVRSFGSAVVFGLVLGLLNAVLHPVLMILGLPFIILTLGLFMIAINAFVFWLADKLVDGVECSGPAAVILGSLVVTLFSWACSFVLLSHHQHW